MKEKGRVGVEELRMEVNYLFVLVDWLIFPVVVVPVDLRMLPIVADVFVVVN